MQTNIETGNASVPAGADETARGYMLRAEAACAQGDLALGTHLYLAAAERAAADASMTDEDVARGLKQAWTLAIDARERALAEYIFDKMEPFLTADELSACAGQLQELALLKLEEFGISRQALEGMSQLQEGQTLGPDGPRLMHVEHINLPLPSSLPIQEERYSQPLGQDLSESAAAKPADENPPAKEEPQVLPADLAELAEPARIVEGDHIPAPSDARFDPSPDLLLEPTLEDDPLDPEMEEARRAIDRAIAAAQADSALPGVGFRAPDGSKPSDEQVPLNQSYVIDDMLAAMGNMMDAAAQEGFDSQADQERMLTFPGKPALPATPTNAATMTMPAPAQPSAGKVTSSAKPAPKKKGGSANDFTLKDLHGYQKALALVDSLGLGLSDDPEFDQLVELLNQRHGLDQAPPADALLFRAPVREDALRFVEALVGQINLPSLRMRMEDGPQGTQTLCIMTRAGRRPRMNNAHTAFEAPAVLVVEDLDLWAVPSIEQPAEDGIAALVASQMTRGARDAVALIRSAVEDPNVYVVVTSCSLGQIDPYFCDLVTPFTVVDIENPTEEERLDIWNIIMEDHPSVRGIPLDRLVELSAGLSREDIFLATREAIEESYREGLALRTYLPVTAQSLYAKLSAFFPLDSKEYRALEDLVVDDLRSALDGSVDELLGLA